MEFRWSRLSEQDYGGFLEVIRLVDNRLIVSSGYCSESINDRKVYRIGKFDKTELPDPGDFMEDSIDPFCDQAEELAEFLHLPVFA